tara:strand:- start:9149 stop:10198 length:1050 start_codon:yes stop_codon:yes gene_type:complete
MQDVISQLNYQDPQFAALYPQCLSWVNTECDARQLKAELVQYAAGRGQQAQAEALGANQAILVGKIAYCLNRGAQLAPSSRERIRAALDAVAVEPQYAEVTESVSWEPIVLTAQGKKTIAITDCTALLDNLRARFCANRCDIKTLGDEVRKVVHAHGDNKPAVVRELVRWYQERVQDASSTPACRKWVKPLQIIANTLTLIASNRHAVKDGARRARKRLVASTSAERDRKGEKAARQVRVREQNIMGIKSVSPENIVGATAVVMYDTRTRHIELYVATAGLLSMQGKRVTGWDEKVSICKVLRKPEDSLPHWSRASTLTRLFVLGNSIRGTLHELTGRIGAHHVILKVM